ncbi:MAG: hypothetical protein ACE5FA_13690 [Dehalococcoidia bacterium]
MRFRTIDVQTVANWVGRVLRFDFTAFDEIRDEASATTPAVLIVLAGSFVAGFGSWLWTLQLDSISTAEVFVKSMLVGGMIQTAVWFVWVYLVFQVLTRGYGHATTFPELVRTMGLAFSPIVFSVLIAVTVLAIPFGIVSFGMVFLFTNIAIQQTSGADIRETSMANVTGFVAFAVVMGMFANVAEVGSVGGVAPGVLFFALDF